MGAETVHLPHCCCCCCAGAAAALLSETTSSGGWKSCDRSRTVSGSWAATQQAESPAPFSAPAQSLPWPCRQDPPRPRDDNTTSDGAGRGRSQASDRRGDVGVTLTRAPGMNSCVSFVPAGWSEVCGCKWGRGWGDVCNEEVQGPQVLARRSPTPTGPTLF